MSDGETTIESLAGGLSAELRALLVCPACHTAVQPASEGLLCPTCARVYPIRDGIPIMLTDESVPAYPPGAGDDGPAGGSESRP